MPSAPRRAWASRSRVEPARSESPRPTQTATGSPRRGRGAMKSVGGRDLPPPPPGGAGVNAGGEPRLAHPRRGGDDHRARFRLVDALVEDRGERAELPVAADAR